MRQSKREYKELSSMQIKDVEKCKEDKSTFQRKLGRLCKTSESSNFLKTRMLKKGQQDRPKMRKLKRLMKKYEYKGKKNHKSFQEIKPSAKELYKKHLYELALEKAEEDPKGKDPEWHMQQIERQMEIKEHFANIRKFEGKAGREGVERVNIEIEEDVLMSVYGREEIAEHIETANVEKRQQSKEPL